MASSKLEGAGGSGVEGTEAAPNGSPNAPSRVASTDGSTDGSTRDPTTTLTVLQDWLRTVGPVATINPLMLNRAVEPRQRASKPRIARGKA